MGHLNSKVNYQDLYNMWHNSVAEYEVRWVRCASRSVDTQFLDGFVESMNGVDTLV